MESICVKTFYINESKAVLKYYAFVLAGLSSRLFVQSSNGLFLHVTAYNKEIWLSLFTVNRTVQMYS